MVYICVQPSTFYYAWQVDAMLLSFEKCGINFNNVHIVSVKYPEKGIDTQDRNLLRQRANTLVTRTSQAALTASKGAGFVKGHPAEHLIRESMFYLVWSCPQSVTESLLCNFAGLENQTSIPSTNQLKD